MPTKDNIFRMDFIQEIESVDEEKRTFRARLIPNPERYEVKEINGEKGYYDKFDNFFISLKEIEKGLKKSIGAPIFYTPPKIRDSLEYTKSRIPEIKRHFEEDTEDYVFSDASEEFLETLPQGEKTFVILNIDLMGSTKMSQELESEENAKVISLFSKEMALLVHAFNGYVLKYLGDGLIAYFPEPNFNGMNDNALDCASSMKLLILCGINPVLKEKGLLELSFRIGLDSGEATVVIVGADRIKKHKDLIGETINLASKIQSIAEKNQILIGDATARNVHTFWRKLLIKKELLPNWEYTVRNTKEFYPLYFLKEPNI
ncbi:MAG: adenylate/guanylate cyclase domain-containing protein [Candidatus Aenigmarchaeota archaeon]|nr:adenylate/guanylate cyclase domain-containing protein [Candidatus Aenigmarchaeota archaeon]